MKRRLPDVNRIIAEVQTTVTASQLEKNASVEPCFSVPLASSLYKLAETLKTAKISKVTYSDVGSLGKKLLEN